MSPGYLHINPINMTANETVSLTPEALILYPEGSPEYAYILSLIGAWDNYASPTITLNASASVEVIIGDKVGTAIGNCSAYIYGWPSDSINYMGSSAIVTFPTPTVIAPTNMTLCTVHATITGEINFEGENSINMGTQQSSEVEAVHLAVTENIAESDLEKAALPLSSDNSALIAGVAAAAVVAGSIYYYQRRRKRK